MALFVQQLKSQAMISLLVKSKVSFSMILLLVKTVWQIKTCIIGRNHSKICHSLSDTRRKATSIRSFWPQMIKTNGLSKSKCGLLRLRKSEISLQVVTDRKVLVVWLIDKKICLLLVKVSCLIWLLILTLFPPEWPLVTWLNVFCLRLHVSTVMKVMQHLFKTKM